MVSHSGDGPEIKAIDTVTTPALVGICLGTTLFLVTVAAVTCLCYRRRHSLVLLPLHGGMAQPFGRRRASAQPNSATASLFGHQGSLRKSGCGGNGGCERPLVLRRPTAVRSPSSNACGVIIPGGPHYLKKSPSPTSAGSGVTRNTERRSGPPSKETTPSPNAGQGFGEFGSEQNKKKEVTEKERVDGGETQTPLKEEIDDSTEKGVAVVGGVGGVGGAVSPSADNNVTKLGQLFFKLKYKADKNALVVTVVKCRDLPVTSSSSGAGTSDPYVKLQLLPDKQHRVKTRVLRKTRNPVYDEDFTFYGIHCNQLPSTTLHFVVLSFDRYSRDDIIGEVFFPLSSVDLVSTTLVQANVNPGDGSNANQQQGKQISLCRDIHPRNLKIRSQGRGEILVSLCWQPAANRLTVVVLKARNLPKMDVTGLADPYVKIYLVYNGQRIAKKKTHVKKRTLNPVFNESFVFDIPASHSPVGANPTTGSNTTGSGQHNSQVAGALSALLSQQQGNAADQSDRHNNGDGGGLLSCVSLEFLLLDWDRVTKNEVIGRLELGTGGKASEAAGAALHHWNEVCNSPRRQIAEWHKLHE